MRVGNRDNGKGVGKDEVIGGKGEMVVNWIWRLCNMASERGVVPEDWRSSVIIPLHEGKLEKTEYKNYRGSSLLIKCDWKNIYMNICGQSP